MPGVLDIVALRSLVAIVDCGGFHRAALALRISQSAVSQHVRRLEKAVGRPLVNRAGRGSSFTAEGEALVAEARRILATHDAAIERVTGGQSGQLVVGATEHAADHLLPAVTRALATAFPGRAVRYRLDRAARLNEAVDAGLVDVAIYVSEASAVRGFPAGALALRWYSSPGWVPPRVGEPWPLVAIEEPCVIRQRALDALAGQGIPATVVCDAGYVSGVVNAARAGLGVALFATAGGQPDGLAERDDLPAVAPVGLSARPRRGADARLLAAVVGAVRPLLAGPVDPAA
jgi:DNA-binding transcriptional LysR family regulator